MRARQQHVSAAILATDPAPRAAVESLDAGARGTDRGPPGAKVPAAVPDQIGGLASLVTDVVACLERPTDQPLYDAVARCNTALESQLEALREREVREREDPMRAARDELLRLVELLTMVDRSDTPLVLRQIRRVLGRLDAC